MIKIFEAAGERACKSGGPGGTRYKIVAGLFTFLLRVR